MRLRAARRAAVEQRSQAPRYLGVTTFAEAAHIDANRFGRWRIHGPIWVPNPTVFLGEQHRPGWTKRCAREFYQGMPPYHCPVTIEYLDATQMCERHEMSDEILWACIADDKTIDEPAMWLDGVPGWLPPLGSERN